MTCELLGADQLCSLIQDRDRSRVGDNRSVGQLERRQLRRSGTQAQLVTRACAQERPWAAVTGDHLVVLDACRAKRLPHAPGRGASAGRHHRRGKRIAGGSGASRSSESWVCREGGGQRHGIQTANPASTIDRLPNQTSLLLDLDVLRGSRQRRRQWLDEFADGQCTIGAITIALRRALIPGHERERTRGRVYWVGSLLVTAALMTAIYAIVQASGHGWDSSSVLGFGGLAAALMVAFVAVEARIDNPILALRFLRVRGLISSSVVRVSRHRYVLDLLPRHALPRARAALRRAADAPRVLAVDDHRRRAVAWHHRPAGRAVRRDARADRRDAHGDRRPRPAHDRGSAHELLPDHLPRLLHHRPWDRQRVHAAARSRWPTSRPPRDSALGLSTSQHVSGALAEPSRSCP